VRAAAEATASPEKKRHVAMVAESLDEPMDYEMLNDMDFEFTTGLDYDVELQGKKAAMEVMEEYGVHETISSAQAAEEQLREIRARWEPQQRGAEIKWRYVAQEFKWLEQREDVFAASATGQTARTIDFRCLKEPNTAAFIADAIKAYYQAEQTEPVCVRPPQEFLMMRAVLGLSTDVVWKLKKMLPGQRAAGAAWVKQVATVLGGAGFERNPALPQFYKRERDKCVVEVHMDDFHGSVPVDEIAEAVAELRTLFHLKASDMIVTGRYSHLKRDRLRRERDTLLRANVRHIEDMVRVLGMEKAKTAPTPSLLEDDPGETPSIEAAEAQKFRTCVGIALYISADREDVQRDIQLLSRSLRDPKEFDMRRLVRMVRYLKGTKSFGVRLSLQKGHKPGVVDMKMYSDTDFGTCKQTRRAMTCGMVRLDGMPYSGFARRQGVQSTSSGEAELYGSSSVVMDGRVVKHLLEWLGYRVQYTLCVDSSAAKAIIQRDGVGKVKHLDIRSLWLQQERAERGLVVAKIPGASNVADLGTKAHPRGRFLELRAMAKIEDCSEIDLHEHVAVTAVTI